jgi:hypothetical protein
MRTAAFKLPLLAMVFTVRLWPSSIARVLRPIATRKRVSSYRADLLTRVLALC